ncbi:HNH endonuclease (plasmid) [Coraliomargarita sp. W4R53]
MAAGDDVSMVQCPGCTEAFPSHRRSVVWCSSDCRILTQLARLGDCAVCGAKDPDQIMFFFTPEARADSARQGERFAGAHTECRREALADSGRKLQCNCARCKRIRGEPKTQRGRAVGEPRAPRSKSHLLHLGAIVKRDQEMCQICHVPVDRSATPSDPFAGTLDHIVRVSDEGNDDIDNLRLAHRWCNLAREGNPWWADDATIAKRVRLTFPERVEQLLAKRH